MSEPLNPGDRIAGYRIERQIGRGGMAVVYLAEQVTLGRMVALKLLAPDMADDAGFRERFVRESQLAASIDHPNIIPIYEADEADGTLFIAMRYVEGSDLKGVLAEVGKLDLERALAIHEQVASALDAAHDHGLVHRDVKPANVLLAPDPHRKTDHAYLSDFGLVKRSASASGLTGTGQFVGTLDYVAPEQMRGGPVSGAVDVYSLGCMFFQSLTGLRPFERDSDVAVMFAHLQDPPPALSQVDPTIPAGLDDVIATAMAKEPEGRYPSCTAFVTSAREVVAGRRPTYTPTVISKAAPEDPTPKPGGGRGRLAIVIGGLVALVAVVAGVFLFTGGSDEPSGPTASGPSGTTAPSLDASLSGIASVFSIDPQTMAATAFEVGGDGSCVCSIALGEGSLWVASDLGSVVRMDPRTGEIQAVIPIEPSEVGGSPGIAVGEGKVWVVSNSLLLRIDPTLNSVVSTVVLDLAVPAQDLSVTQGVVLIPDTGGVWMQDVELTGVPSKFPVRGSDVLVRIDGLAMTDPSFFDVYLTGLGNFPDVTTHLDAEPTDVAAAGNLFVVTADGRSLRITPAGKAQEYVSAPDAAFGHVALVPEEGGEPTLWVTDTARNVVWQLAIVRDLGGIQVVSSPTNDLGTPIHDVVAIAEGVWAV